MKKGIFVTGTGTDVGKTVVTAGILRALKEKGVKAAPMKPIQSGGIVDGDKLKAPDLEYSLKVAGLTPSEETLALMNQYCYEPACSPHLAARMAGNYPDYDKIMDCAEALFDENDIVLVEGAGGIFVPLDDEEVAMLDLIDAFEFPVILVADAGLGTINHTLLTVSVLEAAAVDIMGIVLVNTTPPDGDEFIREDNLKTIETLAQVPLLGNIRYLEDLSPDNSSDWEKFSQDFTGLDLVMDGLDK